MSRMLALLLSSIPVLALAAHAPPKPVDLTMSWSLSLDATGAITSLQPTVETNRGIYQRLEPAVRKWHFTTGKVNGKPAPAQTTLTLNIRLEPVDGFYRVLVRNAGTGARYGTMTAPKYPDGAEMSKRGGAVMLEVHYDAAGNVTSAKPIDGGLPKAGSDIEHAAVAAVKHWTFTPETIAGHGLAGVAHVPICFSARIGADDSCRWHVGGADVELDTNWPLAMNSVVHLETDATKQEL
ncbi:MAG TPA: TonB family protein [Rhodanobacteraceae bacterium]|jgi:TonB family protein|nr:TonB family protein [Rhodanobacteraceae bacterium]